MGKLEEIVKIKCQMCGEITPHRYVGKVEAEKNYHLYKCLYCNQKSHSKEKIGEKK